jgi:O-antigen/teichoic acid export membrane protein
MFFQNVVANYLSKFWGLISLFFFVPIYIDLLGIEAYAIISFYTVILTVMYFADGGLSSTLNREIARVSDKLYIGNMLFTIERVYLFICSIIVTLIICFSGLISKKWLNSENIPESDLATFIILMGVSVAFQLFTTLHNSGLMGLEKQILANTIQTSSSIFRSALVLVPLNFYPSLRTFFVWQVFCNVTFFFVTRYNLWKFIKGNISYRFDIKILKSIGAFSGGMMLMSIISSLNTQIDKIVISKILSLEEFGFYSLAGLLSQIPVLIITPIAIAILPRMIKYSVSLDNEKLVKLFEGKSPSDIKTIINNAKTQAVIHGDGTLTYDELLFEIFEFNNHGLVSFDKMIEFLNDNGISQAAIADKMNVSLRQVRNYLNKQS